VRGNIPLKDYGGKVFLDIDRLIFSVELEEQKIKQLYKHKSSASRRVLDFAIPKPLVFI
jgi:hypothetical protein